MTMTPNASEMLKAFVEAGNALEQLPKVQADLEAAEQLATETASQLNAEQLKVADRNARIAELEAALSAKEAELAQATFRAASLESVVSAIRGALPDLRVDPDPVSEREPMPNPVTTEATTSTENPTPAPSQAEAVASMPETSANPAPAPEVAEPVGSDPFPEPGPTAEAHTSTDGAPTAPTSTPEPDTAARDLPYLGNAYWRKPMDMTWHDWASKGGDVPDWVYDRTVA